MHKKSKALKLSAIALTLLIVSTLSSCAVNKKNGAAYDHRDYVELPKGTVIKNVPFYVSGADKPPVLMDYTTPEDGAYFSGTAQDVAMAVRKGSK